MRGCVLAVEVVIVVVVEEVEIVEAEKVEMFRNLHLEQIRGFPMSLHSSLPFFGIRRPAFQRN